MDRQKVNDFIYREARLIDEKRFQEWYDLFTDDALYWMPLSRNQPEGMAHTSLFYEDKLLLRVRIQRLDDPKAYSQQQPSFCQHVLQSPSIESESSDTIQTRTPFFYMESQLDQKFTLAGVCYHTLKTYEDGLKIQRKKIDLVNCDAALPSIQMFI